MDEEKIRAIIRDELSNILKIDRYVFDKNIQILDARNMQFGKTTGTQFGTATDQKIAFHGVTPVVQAGAISNPSGGTTQDSECRNATISILTALRNKGIIAT